MSGAPEAAPTLAVLAAGRSRRYGRPKPLEPLGPHGETLPQYAMHDAALAGVRRVVLVVDSRDREAYAEHFTPRMPPGVALRLVDQELPATAPRTRPWGTGAAVLAAGRAVAGHLVVTNADDLYGPLAFETAVRHLRGAAGEAGRAHAIVAFRLRETLSAAGGVSRAICRTDPTGALVGLEEVLDVVAADGAITGRAARTGERRTLDGDVPVSMNLWALFPEVVEPLDAAFGRFRARHAQSADAEFLLGDAIEALVAANAARVRVLPCPSAWHGITHPADREPLVRALARMVEEGTYPSPLPGHR